MLSDYHLHSHFSGDCKVPMVEMIEKAISLNIEKLCFTDHHDLDFPECGIDFTLDIENYIKTLSEMKIKYKEKIQLLTGIELGLQPHLHSQLSAIVSKYDFDFVLASNHLSKGSDVHDKEYYITRTQHQGYFDYFEDILENITNYSDFDVYGHLDYVIRYGQFENKTLIYNDFKDILDEILRTLISKGKGIELNTSGYQYNLGNPHPNREIIQHYRDLGGEIITLGSDAHMPGNLISNFDLAKELLQSVGFNYFTTFEQRKAEFHKL